MTGPIFGFALTHWRALRAEYETVREAAYARAADECKGVLLNDAGKRAGIDAYSLFMGTEARALAYASRELADHWQRYPRLTYTEFERQSFENRV